MWLLCGPRRWCAARSDSPPRRWTAPPPSGARSRVVICRSADSERRHLLRVAVAYGILRRARNSMSQFIEREAAVEDDDSEDDDDVSVPSKQTKKRRRTDDAALRFIDRDAEVEGEEDEDDEDEDEGEALQDEADYDAADVRKDETEHRRFDASSGEGGGRAAAPAGGGAVRRRRGERTSLRGRRRGGVGALHVAPRRAEGPEALADALQAGHEKMLVIQLMQKYLDASQSERALLIKSAMCSDVKGYIYIEAYREAHVREATQGLNNLFFRIALVPPREMTDVMRVRVTPKARLVKGSWARWKAKPQKGGEDYVGDLCQVMDVDVDGTHAAVRMVPRLAIFVEHVGDDDKKQKVRPPARLFVSDEVQAAGGDVEKGREHGQYFHDGMVRRRPAPPRRAPRRPRHSSPRDAAHPSWSPRSPQTFHNGFLMRDRVNVRSAPLRRRHHPSLQELERFRVDSRRWTHAWAGTITAPLRCDAPEHNAGARPLHLSTRSPSPAARQPAEGVVREGRHRPRRRRRPQAPGGRRAGRLGRRQYGGDPAEARAADAALVLPGGAPRQVLHDGLARQGDRRLAAPRRDGPRRPRRRGGREGGGRRGAGGVRHDADDLLRPDAPGGRGARDPRPGVRRRLGRAGAGWRLRAPRHGDARPRRGGRRDQGRALVVQGAHDEEHGGHRAAPADGAKKTSRGVVALDPHQQRLEVLARPAARGEAQGNGGDGTSRAPPPRPAPPAPTRPPTHSLPSTATHPHPHPARPPPLLCR